MVIFHSYVSLPEGISPQKTLLRGRPPVARVERWMKWMKPSRVDRPPWGEAQIATRWLRWVHNPDPLSIPYIFHIIPNPNIWTTWFPIFCMLFLNQGLFGPGIPLQTLHMLFLPRPFERASSGEEKWTCREPQLPNQCVMTWCHCHVDVTEVPVRSLRVGQRLTGIIQQIGPFGLFVDVGAQRDGLARCQGGIGTGWHRYGIS